MKSKLAVLTLAATTIAGAVALAPPVQASSSSSSLAQIANFINKAYDRCLDSNANGAVYIQACNGGLYQKWEWVHGGAHSGKMLKNRATRRCLAFADSGGVSTKPCSSNNFYQSWYYHSGTFRLLAGGYTDPVNSLKLQATSTVGVRVIPDTPPAAPDSTKWDVLATGS
ncbi:RICIN domain-containing protein [Nonomuraea typhae]|uniref:RICIN domain-containing protein n=1 Tax=Nonomuraea typhae TaxID=2603600 RepID=UPI0012F9EE22|nr:ricin-type beta-trefoil lectin domain protein [Nonomuraea typhae]